jgi:hypothetical protein
VFFPLEDSLPLAPLVLPLRETDLLEDAPADGRFDTLPTWMDEPRDLEKVVKEVVARVIAEESAGMWSNPTLKLYGKPGEPRADFDGRCAAAIRERVDDAVARLRESAEKKADQLEDRIRRLEEREAREAASHKSRQA